jgi:hypothetical protein
VLPPGLDNITKKEDMIDFPSPEQLKGKYVVKHKFKPSEKRFIPKYMKSQGRS